MITVAIVEGYPLAAAGMESVLTAEGDIHIVGSHATVGELLATAAAPDVVVLATPNQAKDPLQPVRTYREQSGRRARGASLVLVAEELDGDLAVEAISLGVRGMMLKTMPVHLLPKCVRKVAAGERWIESQSHSRALEHLVATAREPLPDHRLSHREVEVLRLVAIGRRNREIAEALAIAEGTVKAHVHNLCAKLRVKSRVGLARFVMTED